MAAIKQIRVRVLVDFTLEGLKYRCDQVALLPADAAKALKEQGIVDDNKAAVDYALEQNGEKVIPHISAAQAAAQQAIDDAQARIDELAGLVTAETDAAKKADLEAQLVATRTDLAALQA